MERNSSWRTMFGAVTCTACHAPRPLQYGVLYVVNTQCSIQTLNPNDSHELGRSLDYYINFNCFYERSISKHSWISVNRRKKSSKSVKRRDLPVQVPMETVAGGLESCTCDLFICLSVLSLHPVPLYNFVCFISSIMYTTLQWS